MSLHLSKYHIVGNNMSRLKIFLFFRETDLELHLSEKGNKKVEEDMGYIMLQVKLVPKTQEEKEQVSTLHRTEHIVTANVLKFQTLFSFFSQTKCGLE